MKTLDQIALEEGTDKNSTHHSYTRYYSMFFNKYRYDPVNLLEIGIWQNQSLKMWEQFFGNGNIYGIDYEDKSHYDGGRIKTFIADQSDPSQLVNVISKLPELDIVIEDGSHRSPHQILSFATIFPYIKPGGFYVVEDILTGYNSTFCKPNETSIIDYLKSLVGSVQMNGKITDLCSDKRKAIKKYEGDYFEKNIEYMVVCCGLCIIKKI